MTTAARAPLSAVWAVTVFALWLLAGVCILAAPRAFHEWTPGVDLFGPFNPHFIRDVGLVYIASGLVGLRGVRIRSAPLCIAAAVWSCLHAVFHLHVWIERGTPFDRNFFFDLAFVVTPPWVVIAVARRSWPCPMSMPDWQCPWPTARQAESTLDL